MRAYNLLLCYGINSCVVCCRCPLLVASPAIIGIAPGTALVGTAMSVRLKNSCAARNQEMRLANKAISARLLGK